MHIGLEASAQIGDTGIDAIPEGVEFVIVGAVQYLLFDESPQSFDQIQVGRIGRQERSSMPSSLALPATDKVDPNVIKLSNNPLIYFALL